MNCISATVAGFSPAPSAAHASWEQMVYRVSCLTNRVKVTHEAQLVGSNSGGWTVDTHLPHAAAEAVAAEAGQSV